MTSNQIAFAGVQENVRHNKATEKQGAINLAENKRHNLASEKYYTGTLSESSRHNRAQERLTQSQIMRNYTVGMANAGASYAHAAAAADSARAALDNALTNRYKSYSEIAKNQATAEREGAQADSIKRAADRDDEKWTLDSAIRKQQNVRDWIKAGTDIVDAVTDIIPQTRASKNANKVLKKLPDGKTTVTKNASGTTTTTKKTTNTSGKKGKRK